MDDPVDYELPQGKVLGEWADRGLCVGKPIEWFFPERGESLREAKALCRVCPVRHQCQEHAIRHSERFGVWGGLSERERRRFRKAAAGGKSTKGQAA